MNQIHQTLISAIIRKAELVCTGSLALIGIYGSAATGDLHEKSDLDLLILINDDHGWQLADTFLLADSGVGYDLYCTSWQMLESDAECRHAHLSKLMDSTLVYVNDPSAVERLESLSRTASDLLASETRFDRANDALENAKKHYADCFLTDHLPELRANAGAAIHFLLDAIMLWHGCYFRKGVKRTFEELAALHLPFDAEHLVLSVIRSVSTQELRENLTHLFRCVQDVMTLAKPTPVPDADCLKGTYEEMFSNWRNKMYEAAMRYDLFSSFMNMVSCHFMLQEFGNSANVLNGFDPSDLQKNAADFDDALNEHLVSYQKAGLKPKIFADADVFAAEYLKTPERS